MDSFAACANTFTALLTNQTLPTKPFDPIDFHFFDVYRTVDRLNENFTLNFSDDAENFTDFPIGYELADDNGTKHIVDKKGEAIIFPNANVAIGQRALLTVVPIDISDNIE